MHWIVGHVQNNLNTDQKTVENIDISLCEILQTDRNAMLQTGVILFYILNVTLTRLWYGSTTWNKLQHFTQMVSYKVSPEKPCVCVKASDPEGTILFKANDW